jgi:AcrR family transcriptional regulator
MEGVAAQAGVSKGLGYAYFANRDELLGALFDREMRRLDRRVAERMADAATFEDRVRAVAYAGFEAAAERGILMGTLLSAKLTDGVLEERRRARQRVVVGFFAKLISDEFHLDRDQATMAAAILFAGYGGALDQWIQRRASRRDLLATFVALTRGGLEALVRAHAPIA